MAGVRSTRPASARTVVHEFNEAARLAVGDSRARKPDTGTRSCRTAARTQLAALANKPCSLRREQARQRRLSSTTSSIAFSSPKRYSSGPATTLTLHSVQTPRYLQFLHGPAWSRSRTRTFASGGGTPPRRHRERGDDHEVAASVSLRCDAVPFVRSATRHRLRRIGRNGEPAADDDGASGHGALGRSCWRPTVCDWGSGRSGRGARDAAQPA
jgi:hypothetical protein